MERVRLCYLWIGFPINMFEFIHFRTIDSYGQKEMQMTENKLGKQFFLSKLQHTHTHPFLSKLQQGAALTQCSHDLFSVGSNSLAFACGRKYHQLFDGIGLFQTKEDFVTGKFVPLALFCKRHCAHVDFKGSSKAMYLFVTNTMKKEVIKESQQY